MINADEIISFGLDFNIDIPEAQDEEYRPIKPENFNPEWEKEVQRYMLVSGSMPKNTILYKYEEVPKDLDKVGFQRWALNQIDRCRNGHNGMCGKMYFYFNFCYIQQVGRKIRPKYRVIDNEWFKFETSLQKSNEWGAICVKRRRVGMSWKLAASSLYDCLFNTHYHIGMNSKSQADSEALFQKVKFLYENLPAFLRVPTTKSNTKNYLDFSYVVKDETGNKGTKGNQSTIITVAPTDNAYEGRMLSKWICDEAGKIKNLAKLWTYTEDCLMLETRRVGLPIIFGTAGDIGAEGKDLEHMWRNSEQYKLKKFFFAGWMGLTADEYGNDDKEGGIRWVVYKRHEKEGLRQEELKSFIQKYPLTVPEAFTVITDGGVGNAVKIAAQMMSLRDNPAKAVHGWFRKIGDRVEWVPDMLGQCIIYEHPRKGMEGLYIGGCDPADHNDTFDEVSDLCMYIMKRQEGTDPARVVFEYLDRPSDVTEYYDQAMMAAIYFNNAKILIEKNRYGMLKHWEDSEYKFLAARTPKSISRMKGQREMSYGITMTVPNKKYLKELVAKYIEDTCEFIPSYELLNEFAYFNTKNTDRVMSFGIALMLLADYNYTIQTTTQAVSKTPHFGFRNVGGKIVRVVYKIKT